MDAREYLCVASCFVVSQILTFCLTACGTSCSSGKVAGLIFYATFSYLWTSQVVGNVALATLAGGPYGAWYYFGPNSEFGGDMPKYPTLAAFGRASSLSLGSIAFGSLIVTLLEILKLVLNAIQNSANADGHPVEACLACCAACFVGCIESAVEYFNRFVFLFPFHLVLELSQQIRVY